MKSFLSGMPELKLGLNDKLLFESTGRAAGKGKSVELEDIKFHQCVRLARFENDRTISFIPPDGEFDLMTYRLTSQVKPLIWVEAMMESFAHSRIEYMVKAKSQFKSRFVRFYVFILAFYLPCLNLKCLPLTHVTVRAALPPSLLLSSNEGVLPIMWKS